MSLAPELHVAMYHYVRDFPHTPFPRIKGMLLDDFRSQVKALVNAFEMATINSALEFLSGAYKPQRDLCLMTFDDGLKEHYDLVAPILAERGIQGLFFPITSCVEDRIVAPVHMNHFLMAELGFRKYRDMFMQLASEFGPILWQTTVDDAMACRTYPLDEPEVAVFKYLFNFRLPSSERDLVVKSLFATWIGPEREFAANLYVSWSQAKEMQRMGMLMGGHSHTHRPLATLGDTELELELTRSWELAQANLERQSAWPFSYPYGKADSFDGRVIDTLQRLGFVCSFCTEKGTNFPGVNLFSIHRLDCKEVASTCKSGTSTTGAGGSCKTAA